MITSIIIIFFQQELHSPVWLVDCTHRDLYNYIASVIGWLRKRSWLKCSNIVAFVWRYWVKPQTLNFIYSRNACLLTPVCCHLGNCVSLILCPLPRHLFIRPVIFARALLISQKSIIGESLNCVICMVIFWKCAKWTHAWEIVPLHPYGLSLKDQISVNFGMEGGCGALCLFTRCLYRTSPVWFLDVGSSYTRLVPAWHSSQCSLRHTLV